VVNPATRVSAASTSTLALFDDTYDGGRRGDPVWLFVRHKTWHCPMLVRRHTQQFHGAARHTEDARRKYMPPEELRACEGAGGKITSPPCKTRDALERSEL